MDTLGSRLRRRRLELGLSQAELAMAAGLQQSLVSKIENGSVTRTSAVPSLAKALQCDPFFLSTGDELATVPTSDPRMRPNVGDALLLLVSALAKESPGVRAAAAELVAHALQDLEMADDLARRLDRLVGHG